MSTDRAKRYAANHAGDPVKDQIKAGDCVGFCRHVGFDYRNLSKNGLPLVTNAQMRGDWEVWGGVDCEVTAFAALSGGGGAVVSFRWMLLCPECHLAAKRTGGTTDLATKVAVWSGPSPPLARVQ